MDKIVFIVNGKNYKRCDKFVNLKQKLSSKFDISCLITESIADGINKSKQASESGADFVIAVGGDGTINEVANGIMLSEVSEKPIMGILPCGTGNDFVRTVAMRSLEESLFDIKTKEIDVGQLNFFDEQGNKKMRYFMNIADIGVSALTVKIVNGSKKRLGSAMTFFVGALRGFMTYKHNLVKVKAEEFEYSGKITTVVFANGNFFGGGMGIAPFAQIDDGLIDITLVGNVKIGAFLKYFPSLRRQEKIIHPEVFYYKTKEIDVIPIDEKKYPIEADGEFFGYTPLKVSVLNNAIKLLN